MEVRTGVDTNLGFFLLAGDVQASSKASFVFISVGWE